MSNESGENGQLTMVPCTALFDSFTYSQHMRNFSSQLPYVELLVLVKNSHDKDIYFLIFTDSFYNLRTTKTNFVVGEERDIAIFVRVSHFII